MIDQLNKILSEIPTSTCALTTSVGRRCVDTNMDTPPRQDTESESVIEVADRLHGSPVKRKRGRAKNVDRCLDGKKVKRDAPNSKVEDTSDAGSVALHTRFHVGRFWTTERIHNLKHYYLLKELDEFFTDDLLRRYLLPLLSPTEGGTGEISRRVMDWFVVNYAKKWPVMYRHETKPGWVEEVNVCRNYELQMKTYGKHSLDVFCRNKQRVYFQLGDRVLQTVVAQLNFVRWAIRYGVFDRLREQYDVVRQDHHENMAKSRAARKEALASGCHKKRASLSIANPVQSLLRDEPLEVRYV